VFRQDVWQAYFNVLFVGAHILFGVSTSSLIFLKSNKKGFLLIFVTAGRAYFQQNSALHRSLRKR